MQRHFRKSVWLAMASLGIVSLTLGTILAHEGRPVGDYRLVVGWLHEPAYEGSQNAVSIRVNKVAESDAQDHGGGHSGQSPAQGGANTMAGMAMGHGEATVPVEGVEGALQVEVTHVASGAKRTSALIAVFGDPGHYVAHMIPTASGVYEFRMFGNIEGMAIDETFASKGGGGGFDDIRSSAGLQFPEELPELREIESGVRGALNTAQQAQDAALAARQDSGGNALAVVALIVGIVGAALGAGGIFIALRGRQSQG